MPIISSGGGDGDGSIEGDIPKEVKLKPKQRVRADAYQEKISSLQAQFFGFLQEVLIDAGEDPNLTWRFNPLTYTLTLVGSKEPPVDPVAT